MRTKIINGIEHVNEADYLAASMGARINHVLVDFKEKKIHPAMAMNVYDKERLNRDLRNTGMETFCWCPAIYNPDDESALADNFIALNPKP